MAKPWQIPRFQSHNTIIIYYLPQFLLFHATISSLYFRTSLGDVGTSSQYAPPYIPTKCYGEDMSQFPSNNLFAAAGDGIWDNNAACGRQYQVRCISAPTPGTCFVGETITIKIVDYAPQALTQPSVVGTTMILSQTAFGQIANVTASLINIEFQQV